VRVPTKQGAGLNDINLLIIIMNKILNILIVDDDDFFTASLSNFLTNKGFNVQTASSGKEGIESFENQQPSIILLDQELPDMGGVEVCRNILEMNPDTKIIFITVYATVQYAADAMQAGAFNYLSKPFELDELLIVIDMAVRALGISLSTLKRKLKEINT